MPAAIRMAAAEPHRAADPGVEPAETVVQQQDAERDRDQPAAGLYHVAEHGAEQTEADEKRHLRQIPAHCERGCFHELPGAPAEPGQQRQRQDAEHGVADGADRETVPDDIAAFRQQHQPGFDHVGQRVGDQGDQQPEKPFAGEVRAAAPVHADRRDRAEQHGEPLQSGKRRSGEQHADHRQHQNLEAEQRRHPARFDRAQRGEEADLSHGETADPRDHPQDEFRQALQQLRREQERRERQAERPHHQLGKDHQPQRRLVPEHESGAAHIGNRLEQRTGQPGDDTEKHTCPPYEKCAGWLPARLKYDSVTAPRWRRWCRGRTSR